MQNAALRALGLDWAYVPLHVTAERLPDALRGLVALGFVGSNVTIPHKEAVAARCDRLLPVAQACGSVNTIVVEADGTLTGDSTDGLAVVEAVAGVLGAAARPDVLLLGAGGSARSVAAALGQAGHVVSVLARRPEAARELATGLAGCGDVVPLAALPDALPPVVVNCTPIGGLHALTETPVPADMIRDGMLVCDLAYRPDGQPTALCAAAAARGARTVDGVDVLVGQGALSLERWSGRVAPRDVMRRALGR